MEKSVGKSAMAEESSTLFDLISVMNFEDIDTEWKPASIEEVKKAVFFGQKLVLGMVTVLAAIMFVCNVSLYKMGALYERDMLLVLLTMDAIVILVYLYLFFRMYKWINRLKTADICKREIFFERYIENHQYGITLVFGLYDNDGKIEISGSKDHSHVHVKKLQPGDILTLYRVDNQFIHIEPADRKRNLLNNKQETNTQWNLIKSIDASKENDKRRLNIFSKNLGKEYVLVAEITRLEVFFNSSSLKDRKYYVEHFTKEENVDGKSYGAFENRMVDILNRDVETSWESQYQF